MKRTNLTPSQTEWLVHYGLTDLAPDRMWLQHYEKGEFLCLNGETIPNLLLIISGKVRVSVTGFNGKSLLYCINVGRGIMGSIEFMTGAPATASGLALTPVTCIAVPIAENIAILRNSIAFLNCLCTELSLVFESSSRSSAQNILYPLETRLCSYIAMTQEGGIFQEKLTDLNALLGTSYRHLLRTLESLCEQDILRKEGKAYNIIDHEALDRIAQGYYSVDD